MIDIDYPNQGLINQLSALDLAVRTRISLTQAYESDILAYCGFNKGTLSAGFGHELLEVFWPDDSFNHSQTVEDSFLIRCAAVRRLMNQLATFRTKHKSSEIQRLGMELNSGLNDAEDDLDSLLGNMFTIYQSESADRDEDVGGYFDWATFGYVVKELRCSASDAQIRHLFDCWRTIAFTVVDGNGGMMPYAFAGFVELLGHYAREFP